MPDEVKSDLDVECAVVSEYGFALATAAECSLRYRDRMHEARSEDERAHIRDEYHAMLKTTLNAVTIALAVLGERPDSGLKGTP